MPDDSRPRRSATVLVCGLATLDVVQHVDHVPAADEKLVSNGLLVASGGPAANAAATCALLGVGARLVTRIGGGATGALVAADLAGQSVDVVDLAGPDARPPVSTVLVTRATGERAVVSVNATEVAPLPPAEAAELLPPEVWDGVGVLLVDGHHLDLALACAREARARGVPVVLDGGSWKPGLERLLRLVDVAVLSADFAVPGSPPGFADPLGSADARGSADVLETADVLEAVRALGPRLVAQSRGADPVTVLGDGGRRTVPVPAVAVVDTLGAGDVLHGALVAWLAAHVDGAARTGSAEVAEGLAWAVRVASASCASAGARGWADDGARLARWCAELGPDGR